jgi:nitroreductase
VELEEAIRNRRSIRAFTDEPVTKEQVREIVELAIRAPSAINLQPWHVHVVSGEKRTRLGQALVSAYGERQIRCESGAQSPMGDQHQRRQRELLETLIPPIRELGQSFSEFINEGSCDFYGAPVALIVTIDGCFPDARRVCSGTFLAYLLLLAHDRGLGACPIGLLRHYEPEIRKCVQIPDNEQVVVAVALGHPDEDSPVNRVLTSRDPADQLIRWVD